MRTHIGIGFAGLLLITSALTVSAHHSHPLFYDQCKSVTIEGQVESVLWKNPHIRIDVKTDDGTIYHAEWTSLRGVTDDGVAVSGQEALRAGARVVVTGNPLRDAAQILASFPTLTATPDPKTVDVVQMRRMDDSWSWARGGGGPLSHCSRP